MKDIYCHVQTPLNIREENKYFIPPVIANGNLYVIREKKFFDTLQLIGYYPEYIKYIRENGDESTIKWLVKKKLANREFLEGISQYWIEDTHIKNTNNYKYFQKNNTGNPAINEKDIKNIFHKVILYNFIKNNCEIFNEHIEKQLNVIENELSCITEQRSYNIRQNFYRKNFFKIILENFLTEYNSGIKEEIEDINNITIYSDTRLSQNDLIIYKTCNVNEYRDFNFKLINISPTECLRTNTFIRLRVGLTSNYNDDEYIEYVLEKLKNYSGMFTRDTVELGISHLKKIIGNENEKYRKKPEYHIRLTGNSNVAQMQKTQTLISEAEDHLIHRYNSLKKHSNIYFAAPYEITSLVSILNMDKENLKRLNTIIWEKDNKIETELIKLTFKHGNLPYSAYGFASLNF